MEHIGIDVHKRESQICILTPEGEMIERRIQSTREKFTALFHHISIDLLRVSFLALKRNGEYQKLCVWRLVHAVETGHLLNRSGYRIANWFLAATHSLTQRPAFSKFRMAK